MLKKIDVKQLQKGMFLCSTDRKWLELPFFRRKFLITSSDQINTLREYCKFIYIDTEKGTDVISNQEDKSIKEHEISVDPQLSEQGIYPLGCVVELTTGEIGIVLQDRLRPMLSMITDHQKQLLTQDYVLDLAALTAQDIEINKKLAMDDPVIELLLALHEHINYGVDKVANIP